MQPSLFPRCNLLVTLGAMRRAIPPVVAAAVAALVVVGGTVGSASSVELSTPPIPAISGLPILSRPTDLLVPKFVGA